MADIIITEFMDAPSVDRLREKLSVHWDETLFDKRDELLGMLGGASALIVRNRTQIDRELLAHAPNLKVVGRLGVGLDNIDTDACVDSDVTVCPAIGANAPSVAEYVIGAAFVLIRGVYSASNQLAKGGLAQAGAFQWRRARWSNNGDRWVW